MKRFLILSFFSLFLASCGSPKGTQYASKDVIRRANIPSQPKHRVNFNDNHKVASPAKEPKKKSIISRNDDIPTESSFSSSNEIKREIIDFAKTFQGTRYKFGGTTSAGMDCSGLICTAFEKENINLPRISRDIAKKGTPISLREIEEGDLVFFKTSNKNVISHVGLVVEANDGKIRFIHSTTQAGVIISSLDEAYWKRTFVEVRRII